MIKEPIKEWNELGNHYKIWEEEIGHGWKTRYVYTCQLTAKDGKVYEAKSGSEDDAVDNALDMKINELLKQNK